jgi:membrane fusion protein (multidrug efflux system)
MAERQRSRSRFSRTLRDVEARETLNVHDNRDDRGGPSGRAPSSAQRRAPLTGAAALTLAAALGLAASGCAQEEAAPPPVVTAPPVMVERVRVVDVVDRVQATGQLTAKADTTVAAQVPGQVTAILAEEGDAVLEGQVLLEIDPHRRKLELADTEAKLGEARAQLIESEREWKRIKRLSKNAAASQARLDETQTKLSLARSRARGAEARLGLATRALEDSTVRAPFAGLVARRNISAGEYLSVGLPLFEVVALDPIEVELALSEVDSARVAIGHPVEVRVAPYPAERFHGVVTVISPTLDPSTRTLRIKGELDNQDGRLRPGLFAHADLGVSERKDVTMVPEDALVQRADGTVVFKLMAGERVQRLVVTTRAVHDGWVEIDGALAEGDHVVVRGQRELTDGGAVSLRTEDGQPADAPALGTSARGGIGDTAQRSPR